PTSTATPTICTSWIRARIWHDVNGDGIRQAGEPGLRNVAAKVFRGDALVWSGVTNGNGIFTVGGLGPGTYRLEVDELTIPAGYRQTSGPRPPVSLTVGDCEETGFNIGFACIVPPDAWEPDDVPAQASPIQTNGMAQRGRSFHSDTDQDWARFEAEAGVTYRITTFGLFLVDTRLELYGPDGMTLLASNDDFSGSPASQIEWTAPANGTYYVRALPQTPPGIHPVLCNNSYNLRVLAYPVLPGCACPEWGLFNSFRDGNWEVYGLFGDGSDIFRITEMEGTDNAQSRSPSAAWVAFQSDRDGDWEIYVTDPTGTILHQVTVNEGVDDLDPTFPDVCGQDVIAYQSNINGNWDLFVTDIYGSFHRQITFHEADDENPSWSPDASRIAYQSNRNGNWNIWVLNLDTDEETQVTFDGADEMDPVWSPNSNQIVYRSNHNGNWDLYLVDLDSYATVRLTDSLGDDILPNWRTEAANWIAFQSNRDGQWDLYVVRPNGSGETRLTTDLADDAQPAWNCEADKLMFQSNRDGNWELYIMDLPFLDQPGPWDAPVETRLTFEPADDVAPTWCRPEEDWSRLAAW
ncbi:MAG: hypothetical protein GX605_01925, partial [Chloroflexi bacterium]|nr:hypothetical protein [Chloroflexota bacterium]